MQTYLIDVLLDLGGRLVVRQARRSKGLVPHWATPLVGQHGQRDPVPRARVTLNLDVPQHLVVDVVAWGS